MWLPIIEKIKGRNQMKYKAGEKVVLIKNRVLFPGATVTIKNVETDFYSIEMGGRTFHIFDKDIDHEKTAELHKQRDEYTHALMKFGRREGDNLDVKMNTYELAEHLLQKDKYARHKEITDYMHNTYVSKNKDYGDSFERTHEEIGAKAGLTRISDKFYRLQNIILNEHEHLVEDETVVDTLIDLANYAVMFAMELEEEE